MENPDKLIPGLSDLIKSDGYNAELEKLFKSDFTTVNKNLFSETFLNHLSLCELSYSNPELFRKQITAYNTLVSFYESHSTSLPLVINFIILKATGKFCYRTGKWTQLRYILSALLALSRRLKKPLCLSIATGMIAEYAISTNCLNEGMRYCNESYEYGNQPQRLNCYKSLIYSISGDLNRAELFARNAFTTLKLYDNELEFLPFGHLAYIRFYTVKHLTDSREISPEVHSHINELTKLTSASRAGFSSYFQALSILREVGYSKENELSDEQVAQGLFEMGRIHAIRRWKHTQQSMLADIENQLSFCTSFDLSYLEKAWIIDDGIIDNILTDKSSSYLQIL